MRAIANKIKGLTIEIGGETTALNKALGEVNKHSRDLKSELRDVERLLKLDPKNTELLSQKQKVLAESIENTKNKLDTLKEAEKQAQEQFKQGKIGEEQYRAIQREVIKAEEELKKMNKQLKEMDWKSVTDGLDKFGKKSTEIGKDLSKKVTLPILGIGAAATKIGMDFEQSMSKVEAMSGATSDEMERLEKAARDAGAATSKSAKDAADGLSYMALAGWDVESSITGLMPVLRLSEAGNIDLARASSLVTDSMSAMGIEVEDLGHYLDVVAQAARSSNTDIDQMAEAYIKVGGTLRGLNVDLDESALALGFLANAGIKGAEAGTGLNAVMLNLTAPTGRAKEALEALGYSAFDSEGNFKGLETVLLDLQEATKGMDEEQRNMTLSMIGGKEHVKTLNALMNGLDDSYETLKTSIGEADGALNEIAETIMDNNKGSLVELSSALEELALKIYDVLKPAIALLVEFIQGLVDWLNNLSPEMQRTIVIVAGLAAAIGPLLIIIGQFSLAISSIIKLVGIVGPVIAGLAAPIAIAIAAIAAIIAIGVTLYKNWDTIKAKALELRDNIVNAWNNLKEKTVEAWGNITTSITNTVTKLATDAIQWGKDMVLGLWDGISGAKDWVVEKVTGFASDVANGFKKFFGINSPATLMVGYGKNIDEGLGQGITENEHIPLNAITSVADKMASAAKSAVKSVMDLLTIDASGITLNGPGGRVAVSRGNSKAQSQMEKDLAKFKDEIYAVANANKADITTGYEMWKSNQRDKIYGRDETYSSSSKGITQNITVNSPKALSPSEIAKEAAKASQKLVLGLLR